MDGSTTTPLPEPAPPPGGKPSNRFVNFLGDASAGDINLIELLGVLRRRKNIIFACIAVITVIGTAVTYQMTPLFTADSSLLLDARKTNVIDLQSVLSGLTNDFAVIHGEMEVIKSPTMALRVAKKMNLAAIPEFNPRLRPLSLMATLRQNLHETFAGIEPFFGIAPAAATGDDTADPEKAAAKAEATAGAILQGLTDATNDGRSYVLKIRVTSENPQLAAAIANTYADTYLDSQLEAKFEAVRRANSWLDDHLSDLQQQVEASDRAVQVFRAQHNLVESKGETVTAQQLTELNSQLIVAAADRAQKESLLRQIQEQLKAGNVASASQVLASPLIQTLRSQETALIEQEAQLATKYKPAHPAMINIKAQERDLEAKMRDEMARIVQGQIGEVAAARAKEESLRQSLAQLQQSTGAQGEVGVQLRELERQAEANRTLYQNFLSRFKQTSAQADEQEADARIIAAASPPGAPSYPRRSLIIALSFAASLVAGVVAAFGIEQLDNGYRSGDQLEKTAHVTPLGLVPNLKGNQQPYETVLKHPVSPYSEAIRSVRTALRYSDVDNPPKIVLVTSSLPDEGKTVFSLSLARSVACSGGKALVIDCDLRKPAIAKFLDIEPGPGILSLFAEKPEIASVLRVDPDSGLHFITSTPGTSNPQDLLGSKQLRALIEQLRPHYDLIVLDTPPVLAVSDAIILSHVADTSIFLVRWGRTARPIVLGALKTFRANGGNLAGVVLSRVDFRRHAAYGFGDSAYYYGHYGKHYAAYGKAYYTHKS